MKKNTLILFLLVTTFFVGLFALTSITNGNPQVAIIEQDSDAFFNGLVLGDKEETIYVPDDPTDVTFLDGAIWMGCDSNTNLYKINPATGAEITHFDLGFNVSGVTTDGVDLYLSVNEKVLNNGTIVKIRTDGSILSVINLPIKTWSFWGLAWDGSHLWASQIVPNCLVRINPASGAVVANISIPDATAGLAWYNGRPWAVCYTLDEVRAYDPSTGRVQEVFGGPTVTGEWGLAYNGTHFITTQKGVNDYMYFLDIPTAVGEVWNQHSAQSSEPRDIAWNGTHYFVGNYLGSCLTILHDGTFEKVGDISLGFLPYGVTVVDDHIYVSKSDTPYQVYKYTTAGSLVATYPSIGVRIYGLAYDGTYLWASAADNNIYLLDPMDCTEVKKFTGTVTYRGLTYDSRNNVIWAVEPSIHRILQLDLATGQEKGTIIQTPATVGEWGLTFNGEHLIFTSDTTYLAYKIIIDFPSGGIPGFADVFLFLSIIILVGSILVLKRYKGLFIE